MNLNKNKSIRKGFFFSKKKFPIMLTVSNGLLIHLLGCNNQVKNGFILEKEQTNNVGSYKEYGLDGESYIISNQPLKDYILKVCEFLCEENKRSDLQYKGLEELLKIIENQKDCIQKNRILFVVNQKGPGYPILDAVDSTETGQLINWVNRFVKASRNILTNEKTIDKNLMTDFETSFYAILSYFPALNCTDKAYKLYKMLYEKVHEYDAIEEISNQNLERLLSGIEELATKLVIKLTKLICKPFYDAATNIRGILHSRDNKIRAIKKDAIKRNDDDTLFYASLYREVHKLATRNIDALCKSFYKGAQQCINPKSLENLDNLHKILYKKIYKRDRYSNIDKEPKALLEDIQVLTNEENIKNQSALSPHEQDSLIVLVRKLDPIVRFMLSMVFLQEEEAQEIGRNQKYAKEMALNVAYALAIQSLCKLDTILYNDIINRYKPVASYGNQKPQSPSHVLEELTEKCATEFNKLASLIQNINDFVESSRKVLTNPQDYSDWETKFYAVYDDLVVNVYSELQPNTKENLLKKVKCKLSKLIGAVSLLPHKKQKFGPKCTKYSPMDSDSDTN
ncbi:hypothetical protein [Cardinium endosymbiont of Philonthus spinipes]|uniref:hypothetical protein n=1 Tax=Cardinium endosymbiont of Philonthus spinipes TaxID=3077941 RepID=UPI00313F06F2